MIKKIKVLLTGSTLFVLFIAVVGSPGIGFAADSPWQWNMALKQNLLKDSMVMPTALFIDEEKEQYYVVDSGRNRILSFNRQGELLNIFNAGKSLEIPYDMVRSEDGIIWVVEKGRNSLTKIDLQSKEVSPETLHFNGDLIYPDRLEYDNDLFYVLDKATGDIVSFTTALEQKERYSCSTCSSGFADFKIYDGVVWALEAESKQIYRFALTGTLNDTMALGDTVHYPYSLAVGPSGYIYILDRQGRNISVFDKNGTYKYRFLRHGYARSEIYYPIEIRFDPWGGLCVTDEGNARVEVFRR